MPCANTAYNHRHVPWSQCMRFKTGHQITRQSERHCNVLSFRFHCQLCVRASVIEKERESVQPEMDHGASEEKAECCHASRRWGNVNRVTVVLIIMAACCRGSGGGILITKAVLSPVSCVAKKYRGWRGKNPWHFLKIKRGVRAWSANSCAIWSNTPVHCRDQIPSHFTVLCTGFCSSCAFRKNMRDAFWFKMFKGTFCPKIRGL